MPNWCWNHLEVTGDEIQLREFVEKSLVSPEKNEIHDRTEFSFNGTHPMPKEFNNIKTGSCTIDGVSCKKWIETDGKSIPVTEEVLKELNEKYGADNWYDWSIKHWGTKWNACEAYISHNDIDYFAVTFDTAWSPPIEWIGNIQQDFPDLRFELEYEEPGMGYGGKLVCEGDAIWDDYNWNIDLASECCEGEVYNTDDEEFSLPQIPLKEQKNWVGKDKTYKTLKDIPEYWKYPDYQCGICGEEANTINMNAAEIKPAIIETKQK